MNVLRMADQDLRGKRVLIREDLNVPVEDGKVTSDARIRASLPTIKLALDKGAQGVPHLAPRAAGRGRLRRGVLAGARGRAALGVARQARAAEEGLAAAAWIPRRASAVLLENVRFNKGEKKDKEDLARQMAALCDVFVMDAFGTAHRAEARTHGVGKFAKVACAGPLLVGELEALERALAKPARPLVAIVAGSKVSTKLTVLESLLAKVDKLIVGGGIANTFLAATGINVGKSLHEAEMLDMARKLLEQAKARGAEIPLPTDVVVAKEFAATAHADVRSIHDVRPDEMILDIGPDTAERFAAMLQKAGTIVWNGPVGVFEFDQFGEGTRAIAQAIAEVAGVFAGRRRRHARGHREVRRRRRHLVHLDRRRRIPRVRRGQDAARRGDAAGARQAVASKEMGTFLISL